MELIRTIPNQDFYESAVVRSRIVGNVAVTMADFGFTAAELGNALLATIGVHLGGINFLSTGHAPTDVLGIPIVANAYIVITNNVDIQRLQFTRSSAIDSNVTIQLHWNTVGTG